MSWATAGLYRWALRPVLLGGAAAILGTCSGTQPAVTAPDGARLPFVEQAQAGLQVEGRELFVSRVTEALALLEQYDTRAHRDATELIGSVREGALNQLHYREHRSVMELSTELIEHPELTAHWLAGAIAHEARHARQYASGWSRQTGFKDGSPGFRKSMEVDAWRSQVRTLRKIEAPPHLIRHAEQTLNSLARMSARQYVFEDDQYRRSVEQKKESASR